MKTKRILAIVLAAVCVLSVLALTACEFKIEGDETWSYSAEDKEGSVQLFSNFFEETFKNTNQVVTITSEGKTMSVETIDGTKDCTTYTETGATAYAFVDGDKYIYAVSSNDIDKSYWESKDYYDMNYFVFKSRLSVLDEVPADAATFTCEVEGSGKFSEDESKQSSTETLKLSVVVSEDNKLVINATSKNGLVEKATIETTADGETRVSVISFEYGSASVTIPDLSSWTLQTELN